MRLVIGVDISLLSLDGIVPNQIVWRRNSSILSLVLLILFLFIQQVSFGQTTVWSEDFEGYSNGTQQGSGSPAHWTISPTSGYSGHFEVRSSGGDEFIEGNNMDQEGVLTTESIDITSFPYIHLEVRVSESGNLESSDYIRVYYKVNGGTETLFYTNGDNSDDFTSNIASADISGNSVQIIIRVRNNENAEYHRIESILVTGNYCTSNGTIRYNDGITRVSFNTINNITTKPAGYNDYTAISTDVEVGATYNLTVNVNTDGNYTNYARAWIDWNHDGDFDDSGEEYDLGFRTNSSNGATSNSPLSVRIPVSASIGSTRMRVSTKYAGYPTACEGNFDGEVEDYTINILCAVSAQNVTGG